MARWWAMVALFTLIICSSATESQSRFQPSKPRSRNARQYFGGRPEKPRPFEAATYLPPTGYPISGTRPSPSYSEGQGSSPSPSYPSISNQPEPTYQPSKPTYESNQPTQPSYRPSQTTETDYQSSPSYKPSQPSQPDYQPSRPTPSPYQPSQSSQSENTGSYRPLLQTERDEQPTQAAIPIPDDDNDRHPPHIHAITVDCGKEMMTINIEFNKPYNGLIYSQDNFNKPECVYVRENSNQIKFSFTVSLNECGTRFFSDFENEGQAYLENVLVLQNEVGIQEVWDHIRRVRCLWEGNLTKQLVSSLSVGMLNQITSNFSGDTAMARLDIQVGRGPFAPEANGLVKIGETMTLVVTVTGDAGFDIFVRECVARDSESRHVVPLTDSNGCVLKPKLFGAFQKTRDTGNTGASVIAFAYFNAFKFPDEMDLIIQCDVELCKTDCDACPNPGSLEPKRRRRDVIHIGNRTIEPSTTISKGLRVVFAEDLPEPSGFCVSPSAAMWGSLLILLGSMMSSVMVSFCWMRSRGSVKFT